MGKDPQTAKIFKSQPNRSYRQRSERVFHEGKEICNNWQIDNFFANTQAVHEPMSARDVVATIPIYDATHVIAPTPLLNVEYLKHSLLGHPDKQFVSTIINHARYGAPLGYNGPRHYRVHRNWPSAYVHRDAVENAISKDLSRGRKIGPFSHPPCPNFVGSPMGAFKRSTSGKCRVVYDLSWPPGHAINDFIDVDCSLKYVTVDTAVNLVKQYGQGALMAKIDLEDVG